MGTGDHNAGGYPYDGLASHPGGGGSNNIPSRFMLRKPELSASLMGLLARMQTLIGRQAGSHTVGQSVSHAVSHAVRQSVSQSVSQTGNVFDSCFQASAEENMA